MSRRGGGLTRQQSRSIARAMGETSKIGLPGEQSGLFQPSSSRVVAVSRPPDETAARRLSAAHRRSSRRLVRTPSSSAEGAFFEGDDSANRVELAATNKFCVGDRVQAAFKNKVSGPYYPGKVLADQGKGLYDVRFDFDEGTSLHQPQTLASRMILIEQNGGGGQSSPLKGANRRGSVVGQTTASLRRPSSRASVMASRRGLAAQATSRSRTDESPEQVCVGDWGGGGGLLSPRALTRERARDRTEGPGV